MLRCPPILACRRNWIHGFHRPTKMRFLMFRLIITKFLFRSSFPNPPFHLSFFRSNNFRDHYFTSVSWFAAGGVAVNWMNRGQNASIVSECRAQAAWRCQEVRLKREKRGDCPDCTGWPFSSDTLESAYMIQRL